MTATYLGMGVALLATFAWVGFGFARFRPTTRWLDDDARKALYQDRLNEIEFETKPDVNNVHDSAELQDELGVALLADLEGENVDREETSSSLLGISLAVGIVVSSLILYLHWGDPGAVSIRNVGSAVMGSHTTQRDLNEVTKRLNARVESRPQDRTSRYYLALAHFKAERFADAAEAFARVQVPGETPLIDVDVSWAQAAFLAAGGLLDTDARSVVDRIQAYRPDHPSVLELLVLDAVQRRQHDSVVTYSDRALRQKIAKAQRDFFEGVLIAARAEMNPSRSHVNVSIDVRSIPKELTWLLVYARLEKTGPPLAVVKRPLDGRGAYTVTLDDAVSMNPSRPISSAEHVYVVARVSVTGSANKHPGDMERHSELLAVNGTTVRLSFVND